MTHVVSTQLPARPRHAAVPVGRTGADTAADTVAGKTTSGGTPATVSGLSRAARALYFRRIDVGRFRRWRQRRAGEDEPSYVEQRLRAYVRERLTR